MEEQQSNNPQSQDVNDFKTEAQPITTRDVDVGQLLDVHATAEQERKVLRKLDLIIIPLMGLCYMMQYMDKLALSQATLFNLRQDLKLEGQQYSWTSAIFYFGYFAWSWPSSYLCVRLPLAKYVSVSIFVWGGVLMCHAAAKNYGGLLTARFFLGVGEAAVAPGFSLIVSMFYRREEQPSRQAAWFAGNCVASIIGGVIAYGIGTAKQGDLASWQLLFLALGAITSGLALFLIVFLPDSPKSAIFLTKEERVIALHRTLSNRTGMMDTGAFKWDQAWAAIRDPQTWFLVLYTFCVNMCNGGLTSFLSVIINGFGFSELKSLLMQMPIGAAQLIFLGLTITFASWVPNTRILCMIFNTLVGVIGMVMVWKLDEHNQKGRLVGLCLAAVFAINIPFSMSLVSSNVAGFTKRSITSALVFVAYCVGNIVGPQFFLAAQEPEYPTGMKSSISGLALGAFFLICLLVYYIFENRRRDSLYGPPSALTEAEEIVEGLSNKTDLEIEMIIRAYSAENALRQNLSFIFFSDHNTDTSNSIIGAYQAALAPELLICRAIEVTTRHGHWQAAGLDREQLIDWRYQLNDNPGFADATEQVHRAGGFVSVNHPYAACPTCNWGFDDWEHNDAIEVWSADWDPTDEQAVEKWHSLLVAGQFTTAIGGSDSHSPASLNGIPTTVVNTNGRKQAAIVAAVKNAKAYVVQGPGKSMSFNVRMLGGATAQIGDKVKGDSLAAQAILSVEGMSGQKACFISEKGYFHNTTITDGKPVLDFLLTSSSSELR